ncbi:Hypothetical protein SRAE_2000204200 [Strongyloides ratti]|uniref:Uncharacterized protein n=1 Tax=Strongyloides ratti TaxID=34506 RepID=A0A090LGX1_STRRB|nr:Hypothetical protein SRAE_2000204200 [Strongyloides ratti]CEF67378.1 Hypothetical protein SRAE_2000204200 [Strongyloides ratti]
MPYQETGIIDQVFTFYVKSFIKSYQFWLKCCDENNSNNILKKVHSAIEKSEQIIDETVTAIEDDIKDVVGSVFEKESRTQAVFQKYFGILISTYKFNIILLLLILFASIYFYKKICSKLDENKNKDIQCSQSNLSENDSTQVDGKNKNNEHLTTKIKEIVHKLAGTDSATAHITPKLTPEVRNFESTNLNTESQGKTLNTSSICSAAETSKTETFPQIASILPTKTSSNPLKDAVIKKKLSSKGNKKSNKMTPEQLPDPFDDFFKHMDQNLEENQNSNNLKGKDNKGSNNSKQQNETPSSELGETTFGDTSKNSIILKKASNKEKETTNDCELNNSNKNKSLVQPTNSNLLNENKKTSPKNDMSIYPTAKKSKNSDKIGQNSGLMDNEILLEKTQPSEEANQIESNVSSSMDESSSLPSSTSSTSSIIDLKRGPKNSTFEALIKNISLN